MHHYTGCGLDYIWLVNGFDYVDTPYGRAVRIHNLPGLLKVIAERVVSGPARLRGQEVRFLRSMLDLSQDGLARALGQTRPSVARWEGQRDKAIPGASDHALRLFYAAQMAGGSAAKQISDMLKELDEIEHGARQEHFQEVDGWKTTAWAA